MLTNTVHFERYDTNYYRAYSIRYIFLRLFLYTIKHVMPNNLHLEFCEV